MRSPLLTQSIWLSVSPFVLVLAACGSGEAPTISDLSISPSDIVVGQSNTLTGSLAFADEDGDAAELEIEIKLPSGQSQQVPATPLQGADGQTAGVAQFALALVPPAAGIYEISVRCNDDADNASNTLTASVEAK